MVYISSSGKIMDDPPWWTIKGLVRLFWGFISFITMFFSTLINPGGGGGRFQRQSGNNGFGPGSGPPRPPSRKMGRISNSCDIPGGG